MTDVAHSAGGMEKWEYEKGETVVKEKRSEPVIPGVGPISGNDQTEYTIKRRLIDPDTEERLYYLEWEVDAPKGSISDKKTKNMLYSESVVEMHYRCVETDADRSGGQTDA